LTSHLERTVVSEKLIEDDLSWVEESTIKSTYKLGVVLRGVGIRVRRVLPSLFPIPPTTKRRKQSNPLKLTTHPTQSLPSIPNYPSNPKPSFNPKREVRKETPKPREKTFVCMFCGRAGHLDEFCFWCKRIEKRHIDYARNSYHDEYWCHHVNNHFNFVGGHKMHIFTVNIPTFHSRYRR
jgi:hypothetical protein